MTKLTWNQLIQLNYGLELHDITDTYGWSELKEQALRELPLLKLYLEQQALLQALNAALLTTVKEMEYARYEEGCAEGVDGTNY